MVFFVSCVSAGSIQETPIPLDGSQSAGIEDGRDGTAAARSSAGGLAEEIRALTETGVLSSMRKAMEFVQSNALGSSEFGRIMNGVNITLIRRMYPAEALTLSPPDLPQTHAYARILREAERGVYTPPAAASTDYLEHVLPFLALFDEKGQERLLAALPDLQKAQGIRTDSVLAPYFIGIVYERTGKLEDANAAYTKAYGISAECYPAALGQVRVMKLAGRDRESRNLLSELALRYPDNIAVKRQLAIAWYEAGNWAHAEPVIAEILQHNNRDGEFILMRAHLLVEQGQYMQAQGPLDQYASFNPNTRLYLLLRARVQAEAYRNRDSAINYLRTLLRNFPGDEEASIYAAQMLMESAGAQDQAEGRELLRRLMGSNGPSPAVLNLALQDAINRESWREAEDLLNRLLAGRRLGHDLYSAYMVEQGLGNKARALAYARELYEQDTANDEGITAYISALIDAGRKDEAGRMIETHLASANGGIARGRYYYLRSRLKTSEEETLADLRSSLFEDPRGLKPLIAMFEIYHRRKDERRAVYYLKQALAIAPGNPRLKHYESEYAGLLNTP
jgi:tetratricopeptide (TPR) repeat protein